MRETPTENRSRESPGFALNQADIDEFRVIVQRTSGQAIDNSAAWNRAIELLSLFRILIGPIPEDPAIRDGMESSNIVRLDGERGDAIS